MQMLYSLRGKITVLFIIACTAILVFFLSAYDSLRQSEINSEMHKLSLISQSVASLSHDARTTNKYLEQVGFTRMGPDCAKKVGIHNLRALLTHLTRFGRVNSYFTRASFYIEVVDSRGSRLFKSPAKLSDYKPIIYLACGATLLVLAVLFGFINKSLSNIKVLAKSMRDWSKRDGELVQIKRNDEIGQLAQECFAATERIDSLISSRQLFLRSIMHELKTPIGKGRIIAAMAPSAANMARLDAVFTRLELLVNELGQVERVLSRYCQPQMGEYRCSLIYEQAMDILMLDDSSQIITDFGADAVICVDLQLFSLALKNLIDNALKYSTGGPIFVSFVPNALVVQNRGEVLKESIEELMQAFKQGDSKRPGMGLGLYLIDKIAQIHGCELVHEYLGQTHSFKIIKKGEKQ